MPLQQTNSTSDSFWMRAKKDGECAECENAIKQGERIVYDKAAFKAYCKVCGSGIIGEDKTPAQQARETLDERKRK